MRTTKTKTRKSAAVCTCHAEAQGEACFWINNGPVVKNVEELGEALHKMSKEQFAHHANRGGNDFANWIENVLGCPTCAVAVRKAKTKAGAIKALSVCDNCK